MWTWCAGGSRPPVSGARPRGRSMRPACCTLPATRPGHGMASLLMLTRRLPSICDHVCGRDTCSIIGGIGSHVVDYAMSVDARKAPKKKKDKAAAAAAAAPFDGAAFIKYLIDAMASSHTAGSNAVIVFRLRRSCRHIPMFCAAIRVKLLSRCTLVAPRIPAPLTVVVRCGRCILGWPGAVVWRAFVAVGVGGAVSAVHLRGRVWTTGTPPPRNRCRPNRMLLCCLLVTVAVPWSCVLLHVTDVTAAASRSAVTRRRRHLHRPP